jgi:lysophospholipase L1-like esterase
MHLRVAVAHALALVVVAPAAAQEPAPVAALSAKLTVQERGWVKLSLGGPAGSTVRVRETTGTLEQDVATLPLVFATTGRKRFVPWRCDRVAREFTFVSTAPDGATQTTTAGVNTPGCKRRFALERAEGRARSGLTVRVRDRFGVGDVGAEVCAAGVTRTLSCRKVVFKAGQKVAQVRLPAPSSGRYRVEIRSVFGQRARSLVTVRPRAGRLRLLATGDSMIQIVDSYLARRLEPRGAKVRSDAHISTGITNPSMLNWISHARSSAREIKPDVTVMFLGANDGFPLPEKGGSRAACCGGPWIDVYANRVTTMMRSYLRKGSGRVYWLLLPTPRGKNFQMVFRGVNAGIQRAATRFDMSAVRVLDLRKTFTPGGRFRQTIRYKGKTVSVRQGDGVHLNTKGASITADIILRALRADGYIG